MKNLGISDLVVKPSLYISLICISRFYFWGLPNTFASLYKRLFWALFLKALYVTPQIDSVIVVVFKFLFNLFPILICISPEKFKSYFVISYHFSEAVIIIVYNIIYIRCGRKHSNNIFIVVYILDFHYIVFIWVSKIWIIDIYIGIQSPFEKRAIFIPVSSFCALFSKGLKIG